MGVYDMLPKGSQVKLWNCEMTTKRVGDTVPDFGLDEYIVLLREGGYVYVEKGIIKRIEENNGKKFYTPNDFTNMPCLDKWGSVVANESDLIGELNGVAGMDDPYYWRK